MHGFRYRRQAKLAAVALLLLVSIPSYKLIPFYRFWGLDLHNSVAYHSCAGRHNPYLMTGRECGDVNWRSMSYPPLLYFSFTWTRLCSMPVAARIWATAIGLGTLGSLLVWLRRRQWKAVGKSELVAFLLLMLAQFPVIFAMERGNSDVLVLLLWTLSMALFRCARVGPAGFAAGTAAALKLYPVFACFVAGAGLVGRAMADKRARRPAASFVLAGVAAVATAVLAFLPQTISFLENRLPSFSRELPRVFVYSHSLQQLSSDHQWLAVVLFGALLVAWTVVTVRYVESDPPFAFAGGLAIATYWAGISYDYNLLVVFPLLLLLFVRAFDRERPNATAFWLLLLGLFAIVGPRGIYLSSDALKKVHILIQWAWLLCVAVASARLVETQSPPALISAMGDSTSPTQSR